MPFGLPEDDVRTTLAWVYRLQVSWAFTVGVLLVWAPPPRFGPSYQFLTVDNGQDKLGYCYIAGSLVMVLALATGRRTLMALSMLGGGLTNWALAVFLICGAVNAPTGVLGGPFAFYIGAHMLLQAALLSRSRQP